MSTAPRTSPGRKHAAGAFDIRNFIAALIGIYGVVLVSWAWSTTAPTRWRRPAASTPTSGPAWP